MISDTDATAREPLQHSEVLWLQRLQETGDLDKAYAYVRILQDYRDNSNARAWDKAYLCFVRGHAQKRVSMGDHGLASFETGLGLLVVTPHTMEEKLLHSRLECAVHLSKIHSLATGKIERDFDEDELISAAFEDTLDESSSSEDEESADGTSTSSQADGDEGMSSAVEAVGDATVVSSASVAIDPSHAMQHADVPMIVEPPSPTSSQIEAGERSFDMSGVADAVSSAPSSIHEDEDDAHMIAAFLAENKMEF